MRRAALLIAIVAFVASRAAAQEVTDQFLQTVPAELAQKVDMARQLRLPHGGRYQPDRAVQLLTEVISEREDYFRAWFNLGLAYGELKDYDQANQAFEEAIAVREREGIRDISIYNSAGWVNLNAGNYDLAEKYLRTGLELESFGSEFTVRALYNNIGLLYFYTQRLAEAEEALTIAKDRFNSDSAAKTLAVITDARNRAERALQDLPMRAD